MFDGADINETRELVRAFESDERKSVALIVKKAEARLGRFEKELLRLEAMREFENKFPDCEFICGVDEVGRGPLAGPVVAGAVILPKDAVIPFLNDSKKLSAKKREELFPEIKKKAISAQIGVVPPERIDEINILNATYEAMREAVGKLKVKPDILLNDAVTIPGVGIKQVGIIKGDAKSVSIAAASVYAKVLRDRMMDEYAKQYPQYGFEGNKGYGSAQHIEAIKKYGPCPIHRRTFIKNFTS